MGSRAACLCCHRRGISPPSHCHCRCQVQTGVAARCRVLSSLGVHGGCNSCWRSTLPMCRHWGRMGAWLALPCHRIGRGAQCRALVEGLLYHPIVVVGIACGLQLTLAEHILMVASSWLSSGSLALLLWLGSHAAHGLGRESQRWRHGWDHMWSTSERWQVAGSSLSGSCLANLRHCGGQGLMPLVAGVDAAALSLLSPLQWSCPPSPYAPQQ